MGRSTISLGKSLIQVKQEIKKIEEICMAKRAVFGTILFFHGEHFLLADFR